MKKSICLTVLLFVFIGGGFAYCLGLVRANEGATMYRHELLAGDPAAAEGLSVCAATTMGGQLRWDSVISYTENNLGQYLETEQDRVVSGAPIDVQTRFRAKWLADYDEWYSEKTWYNWIWEENRCYDYDDFLKEISGYQVQIAGEIEELPDLFGRPGCGTVYAVNAAGDKLALACEVHWFTASFYLYIFGPDGLEYKALLHHAGGAEYGLADWKKAIGIDIGGLSLTF